MILDWDTYKDLTGDVFTDQAKAERMILRAQSRAEGITGRLFDLAERTESLTVDTAGLVWPRAYPVASVSAPTGATVSDDALSILVGVTSWQDALADLLPGLGLPDRPRQLVTYTGGFAAMADAPVELVDAIAELAHRYCNPADTTTVPAGAKSLGAGNQSVSGTRLGGSASIPPELRQRIRVFAHSSERLP